MVSQYLNFRNAIFYAVELVTYFRCKKPSVPALPLIRTRPIKLPTIWLPTLPYIPQTSPSPLEIWVTLPQQPILIQHLKSRQRWQRFYFRLLSSLHWLQLLQLQPSRLHLGPHARPGQAAVVNVINTKIPTHPQQTYHVPTVTPMDTMLIQVLIAAECAKPKFTSTKRGWRPITPLC